MTVHRSNPAALHGAPGFITQIVQATGPLAFISGQVSQRVDGTWAGIGNHREQAEQIARNIDVTLNELGLSRDAIVKEIVYVVDYAPALLLDVVGPLRDGRSEPPASTLIGVPALFAPEALMEVELVVALEP